MITIESIPQVWDDERDGRFFRLTAGVFSGGFCAGASVLLASYDEEDGKLVGTAVRAPGAPLEIGSRLPIGTR